MHTLPPLPYAYQALEPYLDKQTMEIHHDRHHAAYVKNSNDAISDSLELQNKSIEDILTNTQQVPELIRTKVINHGGGHANHSFFWTIMSPPTHLTADSKLLEAINRKFGSVDIFKEKFINCGLSHFGSGWAWLVSNSQTLEIISTANQDSPLSIGLKPLLCVDVWEHAYYLKFQNRRSDYLQAFWEVINWPAVESYFLRYGA